jgi:hypothetical protein
MELFAGLWLPILLSAVFVFIVSSITHMVLPFHKGNYHKLPGEQELCEEMRTQGVQPGEYMFPFATMKEMSSPEVIKKYKEGPVGILTVLPNGLPKMGKHLLQWFVYLLFIGVFVAYIASIELARGTDYMTVFRVTGAIAFIVYVATPIYESIWKGQGWGTSFKFIVDGVLYSLVTAGAFGWLWPA